MLFQFEGNIIDFLLVLFVESVYLFNFVFGLLTQLGSCKLAFLAEMLDFGLAFSDFRLASDATTTKLSFVVVLICDP